MESFGVGFRGAVKGRQWGITVDKISSDTAIVGFDKRKDKLKSGGDAYCEK